MNNSLKREISTSVSESIKRLKINNGRPMPLTIRYPSNNQPITTVMSNARDDFGQRYEIIKEVGKGGFSTVYQCRNRQTGVDYAVKVVDLRPLRLRERFNPTRLKREVDIMRRLHHPHIIQFIEVYEDPDHLMMVMEYCPGKELFDVILARKFFREEDAKPIFAQVARALYYLHSLNIIHRDIKPENILILDEPDPRTGALIAKLLDFGLSKNAGGSEAKTFVGTPCYLAPEVEYTSKGLGGTYGLAADCWSLGAVLYVMLVARFPEFEQDMTGKVVVKLSPSLWGNVSNEAKDLIRSLMNTNPNARLTMYGALKHPWLAQYRASDAELTIVSVQNTDLSHALQEEAELQDEEEMSGISTQTPEITAGGNVVHHQAMVIRQNDSKQHFGAENLKLSPLLNLQRSIAYCFAEAHAEYNENPEVAAQIRRGATLCRHQVIESMKMLKKVKQTAEQVLDMFPDLELAVEEDEPKLANEFFNMVKSWVGELREQVSNTQKFNKASMDQIQHIVEQSAINLRDSQEKNAQTLRWNQIINENGSTMAKQFFDNLLQRLKATSVNGQIDLNNINLDSNNALELFLSLFGPTSSLPSLPLPVPTEAIPLGSASMQADSQESGPLPPPPPFPSFHTSNSSAFSPSTSPQASAPVHTNLFQMASSPPQQNLGDHFKDHHQQHKQQQQQNRVTNNNNNSHTNNHSTNQNGSRYHHFMDVEESDLNAIDECPVPYGNGFPSDKTSQGSAKSNSSSKKKDQPQQQLPLEVDTVSSDGEDQLVVQSPQGIAVRSPRAASRLTETLHKLRQVDVILEQLGVFWANTELVLDLLTKKGQHVEQFIGFASKPRLMARFRERMEEYKRFWESIKVNSEKYVVGIQASHESHAMYGFLEKSNSTGSGGADDLSNSSSFKHSTPGVSGKSGGVAGAGGGGGGGGDSFDSQTSGSNLFAMDGMGFDALDDFRHLNVTPK